MAFCVRISLSRQVRNFWVDNGLVALYRLFGEGEFGVEGLLIKLCKKQVVAFG